MRDLILHDEESLDEQIKPIKYQNGKYIMEINLSLFKWKNWIELFLKKGSWLQ